MHGERTIAAKTRPRKRAATKVPAAAEMHTAAAEMPAAEMSAAMAPEVAATVEMTAAAVTTAVASAAMAPAATFRSRIAGGRQRGRKNKDGNANIEF
jgi:hypothetical protein